MKKVLLLNKIAKVGTDELDPRAYEVGTDITDPDAIMVRSADMHSMEFGDNLMAVARAGAGTNNIPVDACAERGIVVFNTPGANANGVKELTIAALLLASRNIVGGVEWTRTLVGNADVADVAKAVEKGKSQFAGVEIQGKTLGVVGLGAIGGMVANAALSLGMNVVGYDPYITVEGAWSLSRAVRKAASYDEIYAVADYITVHAPATPETKNMFCAESFAKMKDGIRIVNLSRADLVNAADMKEALASGKVAAYVTDFPTAETVGQPGMVTIPHLGASTAESEDNCAVMCARELREYLENGNIKNAVNFPNASMPHSGEHRICVLHHNIPSTLSQISSALAEQGINISNMLNRSKKEYAYTIVEISGDIPTQSVDAIRRIEGVCRVNLY